MQINKSSFDSEELNSMHKKNEMIFKKWIILLIQQYHPAGFIWNRIINGKKKSNTIASKITLLLFICTHLIIASLFSLIADTYEMKMSSWMALTIPFGIAIFIISFGVIFIIRYFMLKNVNCVITKMEDQLGTEQINKGNDFFTDLKGILILNKNSEMVHKNENTEQLYHDQISYSTSRNQLSLSNMILSGCILIMIMMVGLSISSTNTLSETSITHCFTSFVVSWGTDLIFTRIIFIIILSWYFSKVNQSNELLIFELWTIPNEIELEEILCDVSKFSKENNTVGCTSIKEWKATRSITMDERLKNTSVATIENNKIDNKFCEFHINDPQNKLDTVRDDAEGEKVITARSGNRNLDLNNIKEDYKYSLNPENVIDNEDQSIGMEANDYANIGEINCRKFRENKEKFVLDKGFNPYENPGDKENCSGYHFVKGTGARQSEINFVLKEPSVSSPHKNFNALLYCSPLKKSMKINQADEKENLQKTSPKKGKRTFVPEEELSIDSVRKYLQKKNQIEDENIQNLVMSIKENSAVRKLPEHEENLESETSQKQDTKNIDPVEVHVESMKEISLFPGKNNSFINNKPDCNQIMSLLASPNENQIVRNEDVLDVSEFEFTAELNDNLKKEVKSISKRNVSQVTVESQRIQLKKWLKLAQTHEKSAEIKRINSLIDKLDKEKKPLHKNELRGLDELEILGLPYATRNSFPVQLVLGKSNTGTSNGTKQKTKADKGKINKLKGAYSNLKSKKQKLSGIKGKLIGKSNNGSAMKEINDSENDLNKIDHGVFSEESKKDIQLPPLKIKGNEKKVFDNEDLCEDEIMNNEHLMKIDKIIGQSYDRVKKSFYKRKIKPNKYMEGRYELNVNDNINTSNQ